MIIDTQEILKYIEQETHIAEKSDPDKTSLFIEGIIQGLDLVKMYIEVYIEQEGKVIEETQNGNKS